MLKQKSCDAPDARAWRVRERENLPRVVTWNQRKIVEYHGLWAKTSDKFFADTEKRELSMRSAGLHRLSRRDESFVREFEIGDGSAITCND